MDKKIDESRNSGFVAIHRKITEWEWYSDVNTYRLFTHLLYTVNWKSKRWQGEIVPRGTVITSFPRLAEETNLSVQQVRRAMQNLEKTGEICRKTTSKWQAITVVNYDKYQIVGNEDNMVKGTTSKNNMLLSCSLCEDGENATDKQHDDLLENSSVDELEDFELNRQATCEQHSSNIRATSTKQSKQREQRKQKEKHHQKKMVGVEESKSIMDYLSDEEFEILESKVENVIELIDYIDSKPLVSEIEHPLNYCIAVAMRMGWLKYERFTS